MGILNHKSVCKYELTDVEFVGTFSFFLWLSNG